MSDICICVTLGREFYPYTAEFYKNFPLVPIEHVSQIFGYTKIKFYRSNDSIAFISFVCEKFPELKEYVTIEAIDETSV